MSDKGFLILEDGTEFQGRLAGAPPPSPETLLSKAGQKDSGYGEVVFNTSMTGYQEILTDPSYFGQIVCMTAAHIGNTGVNLEDIESAHPWCAGFVVRELTDAPSSWRSQESLPAYLARYKIPALFDIDTRALTRHLRSRGVVRGIILSERNRANGRDLLNQLPGFEGRDLIREVSTREPYLKPTRQTGHPPLRVVALDFGIKWNLLRCLQEKNCDVEVVPATTSAESILRKKPNGVFLSNGPGDPTAAPYAVETVRQLIGNVPLFGVCMGHQILSLAMGAKTFKLKFGHRGGNQPVQDLTTQCVEISSHNHGYAVQLDSIPATVVVTHKNLNDDTIEGISLPGKRAFSVQYHPEACPGPHDSLIHFDRFVAMMRENVSKVS